MQRCKSLHPKSFFVEAAKANTLFRLPFVLVGLRTSRLFRKRRDACNVLSYRVAVYAEHFADGSVVVVEVL